MSTESPAPPPTSSPDRTWAILVHLSGFLGYFTGFAQIVAPLVVWLVHRDKSPEVEYHAKEALNFQISMTIYGIVAALLLFVVIGLVLLPIVLIVDLVFMILAAVKASEGVRYRYPLTIRLVQ